MATVTESSIMSMAKDIVTDFIDGKASLNEGVIKKATSEGLNVDQTKRLIERTNVDAFLRQYPEKTDFDVADPAVILGENAVTDKVASITSLANSYKDSTEEEGMFKAASEEHKVEWKLPKVSNGESKQYREKVASVTSADIFGLNDEDFLVEKSRATYEYALDRESQEMFKGLNDLHKTAAEISRENTARELAFGDAIDDFAEFVKQASLSGRQSLADSEYEILNKYPEKEPFVRELYDSITEYMKTACVMPNMLVRAEKPTTIKIAYDTELTKKFDKILDIAGN